MKQTQLAYETTSAWDENRSHFLKGHLEHSLAELFEQLRSTRTTLHRKKK